MISENGPDEEKPASRPHSRRAKLLALLFATALVLACCEIAVRFFYRDEIDTRRLREKNRGLFIGHFVEPSQNPELLYELKKGLSKEWMSIIVATEDAEPARKSTFVPAPRNPAIRVALVGDSTSFGWGVEYVLFAEADGAGASKIYNGVRYAGPLWEKHLSELGRIAEQARQHGVVPVAMIWCTCRKDLYSQWDEKLHGLVHPPLLRHFRETGFHVLDLYEPYKKIMESRPGKDVRHLSIPNDGHPNQAGHLFLANQLFDFMMQDPSVRAPLERAAAQNNPPQPADTSSSSGDQYREAVISFYTGNPAASEAPLRELAARFPGDSLIRSRLLQVLLALGKTADAESLLDELMRIKSDYVQPLITFADHFIANGQIEKAIPLLERAERQADSVHTSAFAVTRLAEALRAAGRTSEATAIYDRRRLGDAKNQMPAVNFALDLAAAGQIAEAIETLERILEANPSHETARFELAKKYFETGRTGASLEIFHKLIQQEPRNPDILTWNAWILATAPDPDDRDPARAITLARRACEITREEVPFCLKALAVAQAAAGEFEPAVDTLDKAIVLADQPGSGENAEVLRRLRAGYALKTTDAPR